MLLPAVIAMSVLGRSRAVALPRGLARLRRTALPLLTATTRSRQTSSMSCWLAERGWLARATPGRII
eukprot:10113170-Alexandrium_andersonii.AAC.1